MDVYGDPPVAAAIVISDRGILIGRRNDRTPPWTFVAGEIKPGESPADTVVREVKEETGLQIEPGRELGRRKHPDTGRTMIYIVGIPVHGTNILIGDEAELAEVRWVSLAEAEQLLPGMFGPVRSYLTGRRIVISKWNGL
jgi:8-oxo-dGTP pyrophosphatase MutT (NUDIX family)